MKPLGDRAWFITHLDANVRVREPLDRREVLDLAHTLDPNIAPFALSEFPPPAGMSWRVAVIKIETRRHCRLLVAHHDGEPENSYGLRTNLLCMGERVALDQY